MDVKIVEATEEMVEQLVSYHNKHFGDTRQPEHWMWEYRGCYPDLSVFTVALNDGCVVGTLGSIPIYMKVGGERLLSGKLENALLAPEYREKKTGTDIRIFNEYKASEKGCQFLWAYAPLYKTTVREGFTVFKGVMCSLAAVINPVTAIYDVLKSKRRTPKKKVTGFASRLMLWLYGSIPRTTPSSQKSEYLITSEPLSQTDLDDFYTRLRSRYPDMIHIDLDYQYLKWRVHDHPFFSYKCYYAYDGRDLVAYAFVNVGAVRAYLTDFNFEHMAAGEFLLSLIMNDLKEKKTGLVGFVGNRENPLVKLTFELLGRWGFVHFNATNLHIKCLESKHEKILSNVENWYMTGIGTEGYLI